MMLKNRPGGTSSEAPITPKDAGSLDGTSDRTKEPLDKSHTSSEGAMSEPSYEYNNEGCPIPYSDLYDEEDKTQEPSCLHQAPFPDPAPDHGRPGETQAPSPESKSSIEELSLGTHKQPGRYMHHAFSYLKPDAAKAPANVQARLFVKEANNPL